MIDWALTGQIAGGVMIACVVGIKTLLSGTRRSKNQHPVVNGHLKALVEILPYPAWIKTVETDEKGNIRFRMQTVNEAFTLRFGVSQAAYEGDLDEDHFSKEIVAAWFKSDMESYGHTAIIGFMRPTIEVLKELDILTERE
jgi:hypothetical protein